MILRDALVVTSIGLLLGVASAIAGTRLLANLLYGTNPRDPAVFTAAALGILLLALLASLIPARRAAAVEPVRILRS
jgi:ABC-type antimicrobial peptide transport system permease subunit